MPCCAKKEQKPQPLCSLARATLASGLLTLIGCALAIAGALLPGVQLSAPPPLSALPALLFNATRAGNSTSANATSSNSTSSAASLTLPASTPLMLGLLAPCSTISGIPACASFSSSFTPSPAAQGAAACLLLGFAAGALGFLTSLVACMGCCLTPTMLKLRLSLALLALIFSGAGAVVGGAFVSVPISAGVNVNLADLLKQSPGSVGSGLGLSVAAALLQLVSLFVALGTCCCQPKRPAPAAAGARGGACCGGGKRAAQPLASEPVLSTPAQKKKGGGFFSGSSKKGAAAAAAAPPTPGTTPGATATENPLYSEAAPAAAATPAAATPAAATPAAATPAASKQ